jgi:hypothetical protein
VIPGELRGEQIQHTGELSLFAVKRLRLHGRQAIKMFPSGLHDPSHLFSTMPPPGSAPERTIKEPEGKQ